LLLAFAGMRSKKLLQIICDKTYHLSLIGLHYKLFFV
jgi:hypothetical protein